MKKIDPKTPEEKVRLRIDYSQRLATDETIESQEWSATPGYPDALTFSAEALTVDELTTEVLCAGGEVDIVYTILNEVVTSAGQILQERLVLKIQEQV